LAIRWGLREGCATNPAPLAGLTAVAPVVKAYLQRPGRLASFGLLLRRLTIGALMIHHGQEKLADPHQFAHTYGASLHLLFPLLFAYAAEHRRQPAPWGRSGGSGDVQAVAASSVQSQR
jgi:putative oxidoreductase